MAIDGTICGKYGEICGKYGEKTPNNTTQCDNQYKLYYNATKPPHESQYNVHAHLKFTMFDTLTEKEVVQHKA